MRTDYWAKNLCTLYPTRGVSELLKIRVIHFNWYVTCDLRPARCRPFSLKRKATPRFYRLTLNDFISLAILCHVICLLVGKMAASVDMLTPHLTKIKSPVAGQKVYKDECVFSCDTPVCASHNATMIGMNP